MNERLSGPSALVDKLGECVPIPDVIPLLCKSGRSSNWYKYTNTHPHAYIYIHRHSQTFTDIHHTFTYMQSKTHMMTCMHTQIQTYRHAGRQTASRPASQPARQADRQTETYRYAGIQT